MIFFTVVLNFPEDFPGRAAGISLFFSIGEGIIGRGAAGKDRIGRGSGRAVGYLTQDGGNALADFCGRENLGARVTQKQIHARRRREQGFLGAVRLAKTTLQEVALHCALEEFLRNGDYYTVEFQAVTREKTVTQRCADSPSALVDKSRYGRLAGQPLRLCESVSQASPNLHREPAGKRTPMMKNYFSPSRYSSMAFATEGQSGDGALMAISRPASSIALTILLPYDMNLREFCLKSGKFSKRDFTSAGL